MPHVCSLNLIQTALQNSKRNLPRPANIHPDKISAQRLTLSFLPGSERIFRRSTSNIIGRRNLRGGLRNLILGLVISRGGSLSISSAREIPAICPLLTAWTITWCRVPERRG